MIAFNLYFNGLMNCLMINLKFIYVIEKLIYDLDAKSFDIAH